MDILQINKHGAKLQCWLSIGYWSNLLLLLYIFTMPFVSAFAFTGTISLPLIVALALFILMGIKIIRSGKLPKDFVGFDLVMVMLFLFLVLFSYVINGLNNSKSFNHTVAYLTTFLLFYVAIKFTLFDLGDEKRVFIRVLQFITFITVTGALFANLEFISSNFFDLNINEYIPRPSEEEGFYEASVLGVFYRARGFAAESGHFAFLMELFSPLTFYYLYYSGYCRWNVFQKAFVIIIIVLSFIFAASSASFVIVPVAVASAVLLNINKVFIYVKKRPVKFLVSTATASFIIVAVDYFFSFYALLLLSIKDKIDSSSFDDRQDRLLFFNDKFSHLDFIGKLSGVGPAGFDILGFDESKSILSLYYSLTFELGFLGLLLVLLLFIYLILHTLRIKSKIGFFLLVSVISGAIHYYFIANFWYPWFWFIGAFTIFCSKKFSNG